MAGKIDEQGVYPALLTDLSKNDHGDNEGGGNTNPQNGRGGARGKDDYSGGGVKMEGEGIPSNGNNNMSSKMDPFHPTFPNSYQGSFVGASPFQQGTGFSSSVFHNSNDIFDPSKGLASINSRSSIDAASMLGTPRTSLDVASLMGTPRTSIDATSLMGGTPRGSIDNVGQSRMMDPSKLGAVSQEPPKMLTPSQPSTAPMASNSAVASTAAGGAPGANPAGFTYDERFHIIYEREIRWTEVRRYAEFIRRFATELSHMDITKENFYDLYNMALCLLKSVDGLDPDKLNKKQNESQQYAFMQSQVPGQNMMANPLQPGQPVSEVDMRKNFDLMVGRGNNSAFDASAFMSPIKYSIPTAGGESNAVYAYNQATPEGVVPVGTFALPLGATNSFGSASYMKPNDIKQKNFVGEVVFDDINQGDDRRPKRRRRRTVYSSRRNLHCHMCGVTETPEWRRGPAGDHTLCNACGLHYAKSLKKQRKERDSRKHSIDMLLNESQQQGQTGENASTSSPATPPAANAGTTASTSAQPTLTPAPTTSSTPSPATSNSPQTAEST